MKIWMLIIVIFLTGCGGLVTYKPTQFYNIDTIAPSPSPKLTTEIFQITPSAQPSHWSSALPSVFTPTFSNLSLPQQRTSDRYYNVELLLDYELKKFSVIENIFYKYDGSYSTDSVSLIIEPNRYSGGIVVNQLVDQSRGYVPDYILKGNLLIIKLNEPILPGETINLLLDFKADIPASPNSSDYDSPQVHGYTDHQINLVDFYAFVPIMDENGNWMTHTPGEFGEYLTYPIFDFNIIIRIANNPNKKIITTNTTIVHNKIRSFAVSFSPSLLSFKEDHGENTFTSLYFAQEEEAGIDALGYMAEAFDLYTQLFGQIDNHNLSVVEAEISDGMEFSNLFLLSKDYYTTYNGAANSYLTTLVAHETAHQWWFGAVGSDQANDPWLDEALCTYSEKLFYEYLHPDSLEWWWTYRVNYYLPSGKINLPVSNYANFLEYRNAVYLNGALFLEDLRLKLGDQEFFDLLRSYHSRYTDKIASSQDFIKLVKEYDNSEALNKLLEKYFQDNVNTQ